MANLPELRRAAYDEALAAVTLDPTEPECHLVVADTARKLGWTRQAEAAYRQVLAMDPGNAAAMNNLAVLRLQQGRTGEALSGFTAAAAHDPRMSVARRNVEVTAWKLVQRVTLALWITTWVASALTERRPPVAGNDLLARRHPLVRHAGADLRRADHRGCCASSRGRRSRRRPGPS